MVYFLSKFLTTLSGVIPISQVLQKKREMPIFSQIIQLIGIGILLLSLNTLLLSQSVIAQHNSTPDSNLKSDFKKDPITPDPITSYPVAQYQAKPARLGVVQGSRNWQMINQVLQKTQVAFQVLPPEKLTLEDLKPFQTLFLPNVNRLSAEQFYGLTEWLTIHQGQVILSGPLELPEELREQGRSQLGALWIRDLSSPTRLQLTPFSSSLWAKRIPVDQPIWGGVLLPAQSGTRLVATWAGGSADAFAIVSTPQTVYLGWRWGEENTHSESDQQWLQAALQETQKRLANTPPQDPSLNPRPTTPLPSQATLPDLTQLLVKPMTGSSSSETQSHPFDPTDLAYAPLPLNTFEMLGMKLELGNLLGRVESALLLTQATQDGEKNSGSLPSEYTRVLQQAKEVVTQLPKWVDQGEATKARQEFAKARSALWASYPVNKLTTLPEVRAIWLDRGTIVEAGSELGLTRIFDQLAASGINTVFFETINAGFPIYPSRIAPAQNPLTRGWDPLASGIKLAHERNIELHAWMWTFAVGNKRHNILPAINFPEEYIGPVLTAHPEWANLSHREQFFPSGQPETWLDPANPEVKSYLLKLVEELVRYGVDGIQFDYIRYPFQNAASKVTFGYGMAARMGFIQETGIDPLGLDPTVDPVLWQRWTAFRTEQVNAFIRDAKGLIQRLDPHVIVSAAVYALPENERIQKLQQDWEVWIREGQLDLLVPLTYAGNTRRLAQLVEPNLEIVKRSPVLFLPSLNLLDLPSVEFLDQMQVVRDLPTGGYALFAARHLSEGLQTILSQSRVSSDQIPYRQPFKAALARFRVLEQEWQFLLQKKQLRLPEPSQSEWMKQVQRISQSLETLAAAPDPERLKKAEVDLMAMKQNFLDWMRLDALQNAYRVNTWENRLTSLEILLRYGERVLPRITLASGMNS
jgi:uncharacterized lipoprotein YddW (UPF0748 family)